MGLHPLLGIFKFAGLLPPLPVAVFYITTDVGDFPNFAPVVVLQMPFKAVVIQPTLRVEPEGRANRALVVLGYGGVNIHCPLLPHN